MPYELSKPIDQPTLSEALSEAVGRPVLVAQRPPYDPDTDSPGELVVVDAVSGDEVDDLDAASVASVVAAHMPPAPGPESDPDEALRQAIAATTTFAQLRDVLAGKTHPVQAAGRPRD